MSEKVQDPAEGEAQHEALELVHHHPGRLRVRSEAMRARPQDADDESNAHLALAERIRDAMEGVPGVTKLTHNARTGSLLVEYEPGHVEPDAIVARIAEIGGMQSPFARGADETKSVTPAEALVEATRELNAIVYELTGWKADLRSIVPAGIAALGAYSFIVKKEDRLPRWDNLLYWSYNIFSQLHQREIHRYASVREGGREGDKKEGET